MTSAVVKGGGDQRDEQSARERARKGFYYIHSLYIRTEREDAPPTAWQL